MNVTVVLEGPCSAEGELEALIYREKAVSVEHSRVAGDRMGYTGEIFPDYDISHFDGQGCR